MKEANEFTAEASAKGTFTSDASFAAATATPRSSSASKARALARVVGVSIASHSVELPQIEVTVIHNQSFYS